MMTLFSKERRELIASFDERHRKRDSNLELLRILSMLAIIAHHYVVNSGVSSIYNASHPTFQQNFLILWGMWGKTAINSFILISGYFMCKMQLTKKRYAKLVFQIMFYILFLQVFLAIIGFSPLTVRGVIVSLKSLVQYINHGFVASFLVFYAFIPFYNKLIKSLTENQLLMLISGLLFVFTIASSFFMAETMNEPFWYMTLYFIAAYIRLYPNKYLSDLRLSIYSLLFFVMAACSITYFIILYAASGHESYLESRVYWFVSDSNKILAFLVGLSSFLVAINLPSFHNRIINFLSAGTFAVLLLHAGCDEVRRLLWVEVCDVQSMLDADPLHLIVQALLVPIIIFVLFSSFDFIRRRFIEYPLFFWIEQRNLKKLNIDV